MPDLQPYLDKITINDKTHKGIFIISKIDTESNQILTGILFIKARELGLVDKNGNMNIDTVAVRINNIKHLVLYFT